MLEWTCDDLFFRLFFEVSFEGEVSECPGESEVAIDSIQFNEAPGLDNARLLPYVVGLVVIRKGQWVTLDGSHRSRITYVNLKPKNVFFPTLYFFVILIPAGRGKYI